MIKYKLICNNCDNSFDSWFSSSREYERLNKKKLLICHICNSSRVEKTLMSPSISKLENTKNLTSINEKHRKCTCYPSWRQWVKIW